ncbi:heme-binding protein [Tautonia sociabilis]|nr:heme-binding protein [Tautonia sociabilis]
MAVNVQVVDGILQVQGSNGPDQIEVFRVGNEVLVRDGGADAARVPYRGLSSIDIESGEGDDTVRVLANITISAAIDGGPGNDSLFGGSGSDVLIGGGGVDKLVGNEGFNVYTGGENNAAVPGLNLDLDSGLFLDNQVPPSPTTDINGMPLTLTADEVNQLLDRASAASPSNDAIIAIVDQGGRVLGVRVEDGVSPTIRNDPETLTFAIDGALAKARTGAFFANNTAPLTSRTVQALSESTILQREVESDPNITDPNSPLRGPGTMARIGVGGHFPRNVNFTPQVDLAQIEYSNRDTTFHPGPDRIKGTADDVELPNRFNIPDEVIPKRILDQDLFIQPPDSYGFVSGLYPGAQPRGISTLPGGLPILRLYKTEINGLIRTRASLIGGIGVFFPGETGYAIEENSILNGLAFDPSKPDRSQEAEAIAIAALGGVVDVTKIPMDGPLIVNNLGGVPKISNIGLPLGRIDLVGITLPIYGGHGLSGLKAVQRELAQLGVTAKGSQGTVNGVNLPVTRGPDGIPGTGDEEHTIAGRIVPEGFLVEPHDAADGSLTREDLIRITAQAVVQSNQTRSAIRLPLDESARMVIGITDLDGNVLSLYRMPGATYFSIDVAVAKARNVAYYANPDKLQEVDHLPGVPPGAAFTSRTFRFAALPFFPSGQDNYPPGPFSKLNDGQVSTQSALNDGPPLPASAFQSVNGFDSFNPQTNFRDPTNILNQNGVIFFPGSAPLYKDVDGDGLRDLVGGFGISGDGVDQDDVVTYFGAQGYEPPFTVPRADQTFFRGVRLPYIKFNRQPLNQKDQFPQNFPAMEGIGPLP